MSTVAGRTWRIVVKQFLRGTEGELRTVEEIQRKVHVTMSWFQQGCATGPLQKRALYYVTYQGSRYRVGTVGEPPRMEIHLPEVP